MINGLEIKKLTRFTDTRGYFQENIRVTDDFFGGFGQWSQSLMWQGVIKAWHIHHIQTDYWLVPIGVIRAVFCDMRGNSATYKQIDECMMGDGYEPIVIKIPPGVAHGCKVLQGPAILTYITSHIYDPDDEGRIPYDDLKIEYDWHKEVIK